jgi:hypothetical protein
MVRTAGTIFERAGHRIERAPPELGEVGTGDREACRYVIDTLATEYRENSLKALLRLADLR